MIIHLIRHGKTPGNEEKRYIGVTDEALSENGVESIREKIYPSCEAVVVSPMKRCLQTAELIYSGEQIQKQMVVPDFRETDFGLFEGKNYMELSGNALYQQWIDSNGTMDFPEGESIQGFKNRVLQAFQDLQENLMLFETVSFVVHGGTIMTLLECYEKKHGYYDWQCKNGCGYTVEWKDGEMTVIREI